MAEKKYWQGIGISSGISSGKVWFLQEPNQEIEEIAIDVFCTPEIELRRLEEAVDLVEKNLKEIECKMRVEQNQEAAEIFSAHQVMLRDDAFSTEAGRRIKAEKNLSAKGAIQQVAQEITATFEALDDVYFQERATDIRDLLRQIVNALGNAKDSCLTFPEEGHYVVIAEELTPAQTIQLPKDRVAGFIVNKGGKTSHVAILAKTYGIPSVIIPDSSWETLNEAEFLKVDGATGKVESLVFSEMEELASNPSSESVNYREQIPAENRHITLAGNVGSPNDLALLDRFQAHGVGLYRTEFLFMGDALPTEDEQTEAYRKVIAHCAPHTTVIRTLDIGGDKQSPALNLPKETNPFLGVRALRFCFQEPELFLTQLKAIWRASAAGPTAVMFPMIGTFEELVKAKEFLAKAREMVIAENHPVGEIQVGMMIEIPAAALLARQFAKEVDFFSIGTNDLIQYTMAADRENGAISYLSQTYNPAVLRLISEVAKAGKEAGIWTGICGEAGGDPLLTKFFVAAGINELSMSPGQLPEVGKKLAKNILSEKEKEAYIETILSCFTEEEVKTKL